MKTILQRLAISAGALVIGASAVLADTVSRVNVMPDRQVRPGGDRTRPL